MRRLRGGRGRRLSGNQRPLDDGQREGEGRALSRFAYDRERAAERLRKALGQRQPDAVAHDAPLAGRTFEVVEDLETVEDVADILGFDALARVGDPQPRARHPGFERQRDPAAAGRIFAGVGDQVAEDLLQGIAVAHDHGPGRGQRQMQVDAPLLDHVVEVVDERRKQLRGIDLRITGLVMARIGAAEVHQLADQTLHARRVVADDPHVAHHLRSEAVASEQLLPGAVDERQRRAELVGDGGEETQLRLVAFALLRTVHRLDEQAAPLLDAFVGDEVDRIDRSGEQQQVGHIGQRRVPPRRPHADVQRRLAVAPNLVAVGRPHRKRVVSGRHVGEDRRVVRTRIDPVVVEAPQDVGIFAALVADVLQGRETHGEEVLVVRQDDLPVRVEVGQRILPHGEALQQHAGRIVAQMDVVGIEAVEALHPAEEHLARRGAVVGAVGEFVALQPLETVVADHLARRGVEPRQSLVRAQPQIARIVLQNAVDGVVGKPLPLGVPAEGDRSVPLPDQPVESVSGADPECRIAGHIERKDVVAADRTGVRGGRVDLETARRGVEAVQASAARAEPQPSAVRRGDREDAVVAQRRRILLVVDVDPLVENFVTPVGRAAQPQSDESVSVRAEPQPVVHRVAQDGVDRTEAAPRQRIERREAPRGERQDVEPLAVVADEQIVVAARGQGVNRGAAQAVRTVVTPARMSVRPQHADAVALRGDVEVAARILVKGPHRGALPVEELPVVRAVELQVILVEAQHPLTVAARPENLLRALQQREHRNAGKLPERRKGPRRGVEEAGVGARKGADEASRRGFGNGAEPLLGGRRKRQAHEERELARGVVVDPEEGLLRGDVGPLRRIEERRDPLPRKQRRRRDRLGLSRCRNGAAHLEQIARCGEQQQPSRSRSPEHTHRRGIDLRHVEGRKLPPAVVVAGDAPPQRRAEELAVGRRRHGKGALPDGAARLIARVEAFDAVVADVDAVDAVVGGDPEDAVRLLDDAADDVVRDRIRIVGLELVDAELRAVVTVQAVPRAEPEHAERILVDAGYRTVRQPAVVRKHVAPHRGPCRGRELQQHAPNPQDPFHLLPMPVVRQR